MPYDFGSLPALLFEFIADSERICDDANGADRCDSGAGKRDSEPEDDDPHGADDGVVLGLAARSRIDMSSDSATATPNWR